MQNTDNVQNKNDNNRSLLIPVIIALAAAHILFFTDEGVYDFRWMKQRINWMFYLAFALFLFAGQMTTRYVIFPKANEYTLLSSIIGLIIGTGFALLVLRLGGGFNYPTFLFLK